MKRTFTHSGVFHGDDVFSLAAADILWPGTEILRVRELPKDFSFGKGDIALDIGGEFSPTKGIFDHHYKGGNDDQKAAIGKFWSYYGMIIVDKVMVNNNYSDESIKLIADKVYNDLLASIDRADIGVSDWTPVSDDIQHLSASAFINLMNVDVFNEESQFDNFMVAVNAAKIALIGAIHQAQKWVEMKNIIRDARRDYKSVLILEKGGPWQEHVLADSKYNDILYVIFPSERGGYCIQCVPDQLDSFGTRKLLPEEWSGLRGQELAAIIRNLEDSFSPSLFCHSERFIGGAETMKDIMKLAYLAVYK